MTHLIQADPNQALLLPIDLREWVPADDMVHFVLEAVEQVPMHHFKVNHPRQNHPRMMLALLVYCYANGAEVDRLERESVEVLVATGRGKVRQYDFRPPRAPQDSPSNSQPWIKRMKQRTETERGRKKYRMRQQTVEPVNDLVNGSGHLPLPDRGISSSLLYL